jgi:type I restriction enzyme S subunit
LSQIAAVSAGDPAPQDKEDFSPDGYPFVRMQDVGRYRQTDNLTETADRISAPAALKLKRFPKGSILVPKSGASIRLNHRAILGVDAFVVSHLAVIIPKGVINGRFLYYWLCSVDLSKVAHETDFPSLRLTDLQRVEVPCPPLPDQEQIVRILDEADQLRRLRAEADYRTADLIPAMFHEMFGIPPKTWPIAKFGDLGTLDRGRSKHRPRDEPNLYGGPYPFIQTGDIANSGGCVETYTQTYSELGLSQSKLWPESTLCITIAANIAKCAVLLFPACFPDSVVGFIPNELIIVEFAQSWLETLQTKLEDEAPQAAQKNINLQTLRNLELRVPPVELQRTFAVRVAEIREIGAEQAASRRRLDDLFQSLLHRAFQGEL